MMQCTRDIGEISIGKLCQCSHHISKDVLLKLLEKSDRQKQNKCNISCNLSQVDRIDEEIPYEEFFVQYIAENKPCIIGKWITADWKSVSEWVSNDISNNTDTDTLINFDHLKSQFGHVKVPVANCGNRYYNSQCKEEMTFCEFISYWKRYQELHKSTKCSDRGPEQCLYLKDWHFFRQFPNYKAYDIPKYFTSDWLNYMSDLKSCDDFRFVYMGPKGSWTPFHVDVYRSFSWSANVCGRKRWMLFPPGKESLLKDKLGNLPYDVTEIISCTNFDNIEFLDVIQEKGEIIFVPSGWYHQVHNLEDTISINHNWFNGANVNSVAHFLSMQTARVQTEIMDCKSLMSAKEWYKQCEVILRADSGMNIQDFVYFLDVMSCSISTALSHHSSLSLQNLCCCLSSEHLNIINIIKARIISYPTPMPDADSGVACSTYHDNIKQVAVGDGVGCIQHIIYDLFKLLNAIESIHAVCEEMCDKELMVHLDRTCANILRCLVDSIQRFQQPTVVASQ